MKLNVEATPANEFEGDWNAVSRDSGHWDGPTVTQDEDISLDENSGWEIIECEDMIPAGASERFTKILARHGEILVSFWPGGDPGMGAFVKLFKLP